MAVDIPIVNTFYISSGLFYTTRGFKEGSVVTANAGYIEIPIYTSYRLNFTPESQPQVNFGTYFACVVNGKIKYDDEFVEKENFFGEDCFKRFDCGLGLGLGYTFHRIYAGMTYQWGVVNIAKGNDVDVTTRNFNISVGYNF